LFSKEKRADYLTITSEVEKNGLIKIFANKRSITPSSAKYSKVHNWAEDLKNTSIGKARKVTVFAEIFAREKRSRSPAPNTYKPIIK
jgi:hypothetical protein